ncbi:MAG: hypothetical protein H6729_09885 [Deltaproteobacteria bacterium]|nr:hypothetical protein [Deltaproteobacteria bacterium]
MICLQVKQPRPWDLPRIRLLAPIIVGTLFGCMQEPGTDAHEVTTSEANAIGNNIRFFGYYQADQPHEVDAVADHSTTLIMDAGTFTDERFNQLRQRGVGVFLSLGSILFEWDDSCPCPVFHVLFP